jgi:hypothetical protein
MIVFSRLCAVFITDIFRKVMNTKQPIIMFLLLVFLFSIFDGVLAKDRIQGVSTTFMKKRELMQGDSWKSNPLPPSQVLINLSKYDAIWCSQLIPWYNRRAWITLRSDTIHTIMLRTFSGNNTNPKENNGFVFDYISKNHPEWLLLKNTKNPDMADPNDPENRIRWDPINKSSNHYNRYFFDVGNKDLQKWMADYIVSRIASGIEDSAGYAYDGIGMDNVLLDVWVKNITKRHPHWKYANQPDLWVQAYLDYIQTIHSALSAAGFKLVVNQTLDYSSQKNLRWWQTLENRTDGLMDENAMSVPYFHDERWLSSMKHHERIQKKGLIDWWLVYPSEKRVRAYEDFLFSYCSWLVAKNSDKSFFYSSKDIMGYKNPEVPWYREYEINLGQPLSWRYRMGFCWLRDYSNAAKVIVNPTRTKQSLSTTVFDGQYRVYQANQIADDMIVLPAQSGRILLRVEQ